MSCSPHQCSVKSAVGLSILNCNFVDIKRQLAELIESGIDFIHLDVMDGNFVDDITFGPAFVKSLIDEFPGQKWEVHMMVNRPNQFIKPMSNAGVHRYIFHYEVTTDFDGKSGQYSTNQLIDTIHDHRMEASVAINPSTPVEPILKYLDQVESVLIMTVVPGLGGQRFDHTMMAKVETIRSNRPKMDIELDGGVGPNVVELCGKSGANRIVCGTALLRSTQKSADVLQMRRSLFPIES